jgi:hypothetical protein
MATLTGGLPEGPACSLGDGAEFFLDDSDLEIVAAFDVGLCGPQKFS